MEQTVIYIFIVGLISVVPQGNDLWVLLRDAQEPQIYEPDGECIEPHLPVLAWDAKTCTSADSDKHCSAEHDRTFERCDRELPPLEVPAHSKFWVLDQETITISPVGTQTQDETSHLATLPKVHKNQWGHGPIKTVSADWTANPEPARGLVARLNLKGATLTDCHLVARKDNLKYAALLNFGYSNKKKKSKHEKQPATDLALATVVLEGMQGLEVASTVFGSDSEARKIKLTPHKCDNDPHDTNDNTYCLSLILSNQPPETKYGDVGRHFDRLYDFSISSKAKNRWIPYVEEGSDVPVLQGLCADQAGSRLACVRDWLISGELPQCPNQPPVRALNNRPICPMGGY